MKRAPKHITKMLERFDRRLLLRWSYERKCWSLEEKVKRPDLLPPPVRFVETKNGIEEIMLPELSDRRQQFKYKTLPICYLSDNSMLCENLLAILKAIRVEDSKQAIRNLQERDRIAEEEQEKAIKRSIDGLAREIYDYGTNRGKQAQWDSVGF